MAMITLTSQNLAFEHNSKDKFREVSFSSYLDRRDESLVRKLAESGRDFVPTDDDEQDYLGRKKDEDGEIGVFGAERYFNGSTNIEANPRSSNISPKTNRFPRNGTTDSRSVQVKLLSGTPSIQSGSSSSWNSQSMLLQAALPRNSSRSKSVKGQTKSFLGNFGCSCYCSDSDSVEVQESAANIAKPEAKIPVVTPVLEDIKISEPCYPFAFPTINYAPPEIHPSLLPFQTEQELAEMGRKSLEVFGSPFHDKRSKSLAIGKRLSMLSWDSKETDYSKQKFLYETESDASSDLFEIESLTGKNSPFLARQASADTASCYAPSEASIEWSVVTASAADYSIISDFDEPRSAITNASPRRTLHRPKNTTTKHNSDLQRRRTASLLGCNSHKAVHVAEDAYVRNERSNLTPRIRLNSDSYKPEVVTRFQASDPRMGILDYRQRPQSFVTRSAPSSNSPRASSLMYIH